MNKYPKAYYKRYDVSNYRGIADFIVKNLSCFVGQKTALRLDTIVDIGCGVGRLSHELKEYSKFIVGIDLSRDALELARKNNYKGSLFVQGDAVKVPIKDKSCDLCTCMHVIEHVEEPDLLLNEIHRITSDNGRVVLMTPNKRWARFCLPFLKDSTHVREFSLDELRALVSKCFYIEAIRAFSMFTSFGIFNPILNRLIKPDICIFALKK